MKLIRCKNKHYDFDVIDRLEAKKISNRFRIKWYKYLKEDDNKTYISKTGEVKNFKIKTYSYYFVFNKDQLERA